MGCVSASATGLACSLGAVLAAMLIGEVSPALARQDAGCRDTIVLVSRGSGEDPNPGLGRPGAAFVTELRKPGRFGGSLAVISNPYPAVGLDWKIPARFANGIGAGLKVPGLGAYHDSIVEGKRFLRAQIGTISSRCPGSRLFVVGYSAGAQVSADVYQALDPLDRSHIHALVLFGDPYFRGDSAHGQSTYSSRRHGALGQRNEYAADSSGRVLSYCHAGDLVCQGLPGLTGERHKYHSIEPALAARYLALTFPDPSQGFGGRFSPATAPATIHEQRAMQRDGLRSTACVYAKTHPNPNGIGHCVLVGGKLSLFDRHMGIVGDRGLDAHSGVILVRKRGDATRWQPVYDGGGGMEDCTRREDLRLRRALRAMTSCLSRIPCFKHSPCVPPSSGDPDGWLLRPSGFELVDADGRPVALLYGVTWSKDSSKDVGRGTIYARGRTRKASFALVGESEQCGRPVYADIKVSGAPVFHLRRDICG